VHEAALLGQAKKPSFLGARNPPRLDLAPLTWNPAPKSPQQRQRGCPCTCVIKASFFAASRNSAGAMGHRLAETVVRATFSQTRQVCPTRCSPPTRTTCGAAPGRRLAILGCGNGLVSRGQRRYARKRTECWSAAPHLATAAVNAYTPALAPVPGSLRLGCSSRQ
jgi:hypothetical protein